MAQQRQVAQTGEVSRRKSEFEFDFHGRKFTRYCGPCNHIGADIALSWRALANFVCRLMSDLSAASPDQTESTDVADVINEPRLWRDDGWTARIINNDDDDGWAVEMTRDGEREPTLISPWTMGRDKKNPKPIEKPAFHTLVKTANEFRRRSEQQLHAQLHKSLWVESEQGSVKVTLDIVPDDDFPYADLQAWDDAGQLLGRAQVAPHFKLSADNAARWVAGGYRKPR